MKRQGTSVYFGLALDTPRTLDSVLRAHSLDGQGFSFERTVVPLRLMQSDVAGLESRAQARRVADRLSQFRHAEIDFDGVERVGHSFADELFRVLKSGSPDLHIMPTRMAPDVAAMIASLSH